MCECSVAWRNQICGYETAVALKNNFRPSMVLKPFELNSRGGREEVSPLSRFCKTTFCIGILFRQHQEIIHAKITGIQLRSRHIYESFRVWRSASTCSMPRFFVNIKLGITIPCIVFSAWALAVMHNKREP